MVEIRFFLACSATSGPPLLGLLAMEVEFVRGEVYVLSIVDCETCE
jgi:hypothetical protein